MGMVLFRSFYEFVSLGIAKSFTQRKMPKENHGGATVKSTPLADTGLSLFLAKNSNVHTPDEANQGLQQKHNRRQGKAEYLSLISATKSTRASKGSRTCKPGERLR